MSLNSLMQRGRTVAEYGHALAERVPYSLVALVSRFAVASVFLALRTNQGARISHPRRNLRAVPRRV
jgi:hypothetical protein